MLAGLLERIDGTEKRGRKMRQSILLHHVTKSNAPNASPSNQSVFPSFHHQNHQFERALIEYPFGSYGVQYHHVVLMRHLTCPTHNSHGQGLLLFSIPSSGITSRSQPRTCSSVLVPYVACSSRNRWNNCSTSSLCTRDLSAYWRHPATSRMSFEDRAWRIPYQARS